MIVVRDGKGLVRGGWGPEGNQGARGRGTMRGTMRSRSGEGWKGAERDKYGSWPRCHGVVRGGSGLGGIIVRFRFSSVSTPMCGQPVVLAISSHHVGSDVGPNVNLTLYGSWEGD